MNYCVSRVRRRNFLNRVMNATLNLIEIKNYTTTNLQIICIYWIKICSF